MAFQKKRKKRNPKIHSFRIMTFITTHPHIIGLHNVGRPMYDLSSIKDNETESLIEGGL